MAQRLAFNRVYPVSCAALWDRLVSVLTEIDGVTLIRLEAERRRAILQTGVTWSSWGQNLTAAVEPMAPSGARLTVSGRVRHAFLSSRWGEAAHARWFARRLERALSATAPASLSGADA